MGDSFSLSQRGTSVDEEKVRTVYTRADKREGDESQLNLQYVLQSLQNPVARCALLSKKGEMGADALCICVWIRANEDLVCDLKVVISAEKGLGHELHDYLIDQTAVIREKLKLNGGWVIGFLDERNRKTHLLQVHDGA